MNKCLVIIFLLLSILTNAQTIPLANTGSNRDSVYVYVEKMPEFPGGNAAFIHYLSVNLNYPATAVENQIQGKVTVEFVVRKDGSITDAKVIGSLGSSFDEEALRVVKAMPNWIPGTHNGKAVSVYYKAPVKFTLH
jgi:protein TonB